MDVCLLYIINLRYIIHWDYSHFNNKRIHFVEKKTNVFQKTKFMKKGWLYVPEKQYLVDMLFYHINLGKYCPHLFYGTKNGAFIDPSLFTCFQTRFCRYFIHHIFHTLQELKLTKS